MTFAVARMADLSKTMQILAGFLVFFFILAASYFICYLVAYCGTVAVDIANNVEGVKVIKDYIDWFCTANRSEQN